MNANNLATQLAYLPNVAVGYTIAETLHALIHRQIPGTLQRPDGTTVGLLFHVGLHQNHQPASYAKLRILAYCAPLPPAQQERECITRYETVILGGGIGHGDTDMPWQLIQRNNNAGNHIWANTIHDWLTEQADELSPAGGRMDLYLSDTSPSSPEHVQFVKVTHHDDPAQVMVKQAVFGGVVFLDDLDEDARKRIING